MRFRNLTAVVTLALLATACSKPSPAGTWNLDADATGANMIAAMKDQVAQMNPDQRTQMEAMMKKMSGKLTIKEDHTYSVTLDMPMAGTNTASGTWKLDGNSIQFTDDSKEGREAKSATLKGDEMTMEVAGGPENKTTQFVFRRAK